MALICPVFKWLGCLVFQWLSNTGPFGIQSNLFFDHSNTELAWYSDPDCSYQKVNLRLVNIKLTACGHGHPQEIFQERVGEQFFGREKT